MMKWREARIEQCLLAVEGSMNVFTYVDLTTGSVLDACHEELDIALGHDNAILGSDSAIGGSLLVGCLVAGHVVD